jgi:hypothetical protein
MELCGMKPEIRLEHTMDISSLVAAHLSADNQPKFDPEEFDLAMRKADERRERWLGRLAWIKPVWSTLRRDPELSIKRLTW